MAVFTIKRISHRHEGQGGVVINLSSGAARLGNPNEYVDYAASKGALEPFSIGRGGQPEEVAQAILWLASDEASFITGTFLDVTGGNEPHHFVLSTVYEKEAHDQNS